MKNVNGSSTLIEKFDTAGNTALLINSNDT